MNKNEIKTTTLRLPNNLFEKLEKEAQNLNISVASMLRIILSERYKKHANSTDKPELSGTLLDVPRLNIENLIINTME